VDDRWACPAMGPGAAASIESGTSGSVVEGAIERQGSGLWVNGQHEHSRITVT